METPSSTSRHPIRIVAQRTGLTPATIRAWERRYGAVSPERSDGGQRLYSDRDVHRLSLLKSLTDGGRSIGMVAELSDEAAGTLLQEDRSARTGAAPPAGSPRATESSPIDPSGVVASAFERVAALEPDRLEQVLWRAAMSLDATAFLDVVVAPLLRRIGEAWEAGELSPGQEHLGSEVIDRVLSRLSEPSRRVDGPGMVVATLPGERHGLGARLAATAAAVDGWRVTYLGTDLPVDDIAAMADGVQAAAVAISVVGRERLDESVRALETLRSLLPPSVRVFVGGRGAEQVGQAGMPAGVEVLHGLAGLRALDTPAR